MPGGRTHVGVTRFARMERVTGFDRTASSMTGRYAVAAGREPRCRKQRWRDGPDPPKAGARMRPISGAETLTACGTGGNAVAMKVNGVAAGQVTGQADGRGGDGAAHAG
jgi:hypothetical protein